MAKLSELASIEKERRTRGIKVRCLIKNGVVIPPDLPGFIPVERQSAREIAEEARGRP